jgi:large subunit ribosomal protein L1
LIGDDATIASVMEGDIQFDKCLATADMMPRLSKVARVLGPRGMMPNPKLGTLVESAALPKAIKQMKGGRVEYRSATRITAAGLESHHCSSLYCVSAPAIQC